MEYQEARIKSELDVHLIDEKSLAVVRKTASGEITINDGDILTPRYGGEFDGKAVFLPSVCDWVIRKDSKGIICLIPLKKD